MMIERATRDVTSLAKLRCVCSLGGHLRERMDEIEAFDVHLLGVAFEASFVERLGLAVTHLLLHTV